MPNDTGNYVSEWFGHRIYPVVRASEVALADQSTETCPFLSEAVGEPTKCIKSQASLGVCTISSESNGARQDWLVCPNRVVETALLDDAIDRLFGAAPKAGRLTLAAPRLSHADTRKQLLDHFSKGGHAIVYLREKLGGEISISKTERSPELSFDITLVALVPRRGHATVARYGIFEIQTMDFHGSYRYAVKNLKDALRLHRDEFFSTVERNKHWLSDHVEGPNISNVFKRTFYQVMLKFRLGSAPGCAGTVLALPEAVWDSWQRHLAAPQLTKRPDGDFALDAPGANPGKEPPAWIYVFDLTAASKTTPNPARIKKRIATSAESLSYFALTLAPQEAMKAEGAVGAIPNTIRRRLLRWWPELLTEGL